MKLGIMQPYFMPYIGYFQLINAVDKYVICDDVNYIKGGFVNRNRILINGQPSYINVPLKNVSQFKHINEIELSDDKSMFDKQLKTISRTYRKAPYFKEVYDILENIFSNKYDNLAEINIASIKSVCKYLNIETEILISSSMERDRNLKREHMVMDICKIMNADEYYNAIGGTSLYDKNQFLKEGIKLSFIKTNDIIYDQFKNEFIENLSIIDVMMFNSKDKIHQLLKEYKLV